MCEFGLIGRVRGKRTGPRSRSGCERVENESGFTRAIKGGKARASIACLSTRRPEGFYNKFGRYLQCTLLVLVQCKGKRVVTASARQRGEGKPASNTKGAVASADEAGRSGVFSEATCSAPLTISIQTRIKSAPK
jgi:hypothetical protein